MSALDCVAVREVAPEFALGVLDGDARSDVVLHLDGCSPCRTAVAELVETADSIVLIAPEAEPPAGFERRVLARMTGTERRARWRTVKLVGAVAAAAVIVSVVAVRVIDGGRTPTATSSAAAVATVPMIGGGGQPVGVVDVVDGGVTTTLTLRVDYALADGDYGVVLLPADGSRRGLGTMTVAGGRGTWTGSARIGDTPTALALIDDAGRVQCSADLPVA